MSVYYNEHDRDAARWLGNLAEAGLIPSGTIDGRDIQEVTADDVRGFRECHFFAGIGGWPYALRLVGFSSTEPVWTGSCPCQPFSLAGKRKGEADPRHLWPEFRRLIAECRPAVIFGEQVASSQVVGRSGEGSQVPRSIQEASSRSRFDAPRSASGVQEGDRFRPGQASRDTSGEDQRRGMRTVWTSFQPGWREDMGQSIFRPDRFVEGLHDQQCQGGLPRSQQCDGGLGRSEDARDRSLDPESAARSLQRALGIAREELDEAIGWSWIARVFTDLESIGYSVGACVLPAAGIGAPHIRQRLFWVADADGCRRPVGPESVVQPERSEQQTSRRTDAGGCCRPGRLGVAAGPGLEERQLGPEHHGSQLSPAQRAGRDAGFWSNFDTIDCLDGKTRRIEPGSQCLVDGFSFRLADGRSRKDASRAAILKGLGNAIVPQLAAEFIRAYMETR